MLNANGQRYATTIPWRDLEPVRPDEVVWEVLLSAPWLAAEWTLAAKGHYVLALACAFMFFLTALRQVHGAFHYTLGLNRAATEWAIFVLSVLMLGSNHAVRHNHLRHHAHCLDDGDVEGAHARLPWWKALLLGPVFPARMLTHAWRHATRRERTWIAVEMTATMALLVAFFALPAVVQFHIAAMAVGQCFAGFFCVWTVHRGCSRDAVGRTERKRWLNLATYNMLLHVEHHLFPSVPTCRLHILANRLDAQYGAENWMRVT